MPLTSAGRAALASLARLHYPGPHRVFVHDDSPRPEDQAIVDRTVAALRRQYACDIQVLRRPARTGGKAGVVNYVLADIGQRYDYFLLCDNDSPALDPHVLEQAVCGS